MEAGHVDLALVPSSVEMLVVEVVRSLDLEARAAEVSVRMVMPPDLPMVMMERRLMHSALKNLVSNAIKFSPRCTTVEVAVRVTGPAVIIDVVDEGPGIPVEDLPRLFTKFYRGRAVREAGIAGTGLGLVLARQAIERHGGSVTVESAPGCGARFTVMLPMPQVAQEGG